MILAQYIALLQELQRIHGPNLEVEKWMPAKGRHTAPAPVVAYRRVYPAKRGGEVEVPQFYNEHDTAVQKGDPVIRV